MSDMRCRPSFQTRTCGYCNRSLRESNLQQVVHAVFRQFRECIRDPSTNRRSLHQGTASRGERAEHNVGERVPVGGTSTCAGRPTLQRCPKTLMPGTAARGSAS